jgi:hypothetical protein
MTHERTHTETYREPETGTMHRHRVEHTTAPDRDDEVVRVEARERFGGISVGGVLSGTLAAIAATLLLGGLVGAAIGGIAYETGVEDANGDQLTVGSLIAGIVVLLVAFAIGGWVAARIARYDGVRNGTAVAVVFLVLGALLAGLGTWAEQEYNVLGAAELPNWFDRWFTDDQVTIGAVISGIAAVIAMFAGAMLGGLWGERFHRSADRYLVDRARADDHRPLRTDERELDTSDRTF